MKSTWENEYAARFANADGSAETLSLITSQTIITAQAGAFTGEVEDVRERIETRTLSGRVLRVLTGARSVTSTWKLSGLSPDDSDEISALLQELSDGQTFHLLLPDGRVLKSRISADRPTVSMLRGAGEIIVSFVADHSPLDSNLMLAANFDGDITNSVLMPDWSLVPVTVSQGDDSQIDTSVQKFGDSSLEISTTALAYTAKYANPVQSLSIGMFYRPDYTGSPSVDRSFLSFSDASGNPVIELTHLASGIMRFRIWDGISSYFTLTTDAVVSMTSGTWVYLLASFDRNSDTASIYVDGANKDATASGLTAIPFPARPENIIIGASNATGTNLSTGHYDGLRITSQHYSSATIAVPADGNVLA